MASHMSNFQTNELVKKLDDKRVSRFFVIVAPFAAWMCWQKEIDADGKPLVQFPNQ